MPAESRLWPSDDDEDGYDEDDGGGDDDDNDGNLTCPYFSTRLPSSQTIPDLGWLTLTKAWAQINKQPKLTKMIYVHRFDHWSFSQNFWKCISGVDYFEHFKVLSIWESMAEKSGRSP